MRHRVKIKHFNRDTKSRKALLRNLLRDLFEHGEIKTSESRTKEIKRLADKLIAKASENTLTARRELHKFFGKRDVVNTLVDKIAPSFKDKKSGFTTLEKMAPRRGDNTTIFKLSLIGEKTWTSLKKDKTEAKAEKKVAKKVVAKKAPAKKVVPKKVAAKKPAAKKATTSKAKKTEEKK